MRNFDGATILVADEWHNKMDDISVYRVQLLPDEVVRENEPSCESCGTDAAPHWYNVFALHQIDGFGDALDYCQQCVESMADVDEENSPYRFLSGRYGDPTNYASFDVDTVANFDGCTITYSDNEVWNTFTVRKSKLTTDSGLEVHLVCEDCERESSKSKGTMPFYLLFETESNMEYHVCHECLSRDVELATTTVVYPTKEVE